MRILIVDDDAPFARMLATQLQKLDSSLDVVDVSTADAARQIVQPPNSPFDAFLLDYRLDGSDVDGVTLMSELLESTPNSSAVIFTAYDDSDTKRAASKAGAYWYLGKPFQTWDVIHILRQLHDRNRLKTLSQIAAELQEAVTVPDVADAIVCGALRFGFVRARLRLFAHPEQEAKDDPEMVGVSQAGSPRIEGLEGLRTPLTRLLYSQQAIAAGKPLFFKGRELGPDGADEFYAAHEAQPPMGEWIKIPILSGRHPIGTLTLDNAELDCAFDLQQRAHLTQVLGLFGQQAAAALERARLHERTRQQAQEADTLSDIGRRVTTEAATGRLDDLLDEVRRQAGRFMDITNFMVVLSDLETHILDYRWQYGLGEQVSRHWRLPEAGLVGSVISSNQPLLVVDTKAYCTRHDITHYGPLAQCWLGVPLQVEGRAVGALVVQSYQDQAAYADHHRILLAKVADQVAGAIHMAYRLERQAELERQDRALNDLRRILPQLIQESEDSFWHAVLTTITHRDGNGFNRAALFWYDQTGAHMQGRMGIGHFCREEAHNAWERDREEGRSLQQYFAAPYLARSRSTPLQEEIIGWRMETGKPTGPCYRVWAEGQRLVLSSSGLRGSLPAQLLEPPDLPDGAISYECALLPVTSEEGVLGLLVVDNAFDGEPLRPGDLDKLTGLLEQAVRVWLQAQEAGQIRRLDAEYEQILALSRQITTQAAGRPLKESLEQLCREAQVLTCADCVVIYPYHPSRGSYDLGAVSYVGLSKPREFQATTSDKPQQHGVTFTILQSGTLVVPDVTRADMFFAGHRLAEDTFLQREGIHALIGVPLRHAVTGEPLGVIYLDYRTPQKFSEQDIALAEHIAAIGATTISYFREIEREAQGRAIAEARERLGRRATQLISNIQAQALASDCDERKVIHAILQNATELFGRSATIHLALVTWETKEEEPRQICQDYSLGHLGRLHSRAVNPGKGAVSEALNNGRPHISERELAIPIRIGTKPVAVLVIKHPAKQTPFSVVEQEVAERLATISALALDNVRTRAYLQVVSRTVSAVSEKRDLKATLVAVVDAALRVAPDLDCVTLWYQDPETGGLETGSQLGVRNEKHKEKGAHNKRLVRDVMKRRNPVFAPVVEREPSLQGEFTRDENIVSTAAFPLRFGENPHAFGALFLSYRKNHEFTPMERTLFPLFANAAATAIHSAQTLDLAERRRKRLETALKVATEAGASLERDAVLRGVLTVLRNEFRRGSENDTAPYIMLYNEQDRSLELPEVAREFYQPDGPEYQDRVQLPLEGEEFTTRIARQALREGKIVVDNIKDVHSDSKYVEVNSKTQSEICAALVSEGRLLGALVIKSARLAAFNQEDEKLFEMAAHQVAMTLDRLDRVAQARRDASVAGAIAWAADVAHDLNSAIGLIRNRAYWLLQREVNLSDQAREWIQQIDKRSAEIAYMMDDVRARRDKPESFLLDEFLRERIGVWQESRDVRVNLVVEAMASCQVNVPRESLWRAVRHLLRNAVEAMEVANSPCREIRLRLSQIGTDQIELQIEDTGPGVPDAVRRHAFREPYSSRELGVRGRGLGLLMAQWLVESIGGSVFLYPSVPNRGACFGIRLPSASEQGEHDV